MRPSIDRAWWHRPDMREAMHTRDIATMFRVLQKHGISQRHIAALTGQSQSEISEILGGRQVNSYPVLLRITEGFTIPRGWLGLAYADCTPVGLVDPWGIDDARLYDALLARLARLAASGGEP